MCLNIWKINTFYYGHCIYLSLRMKYGVRWNMQKLLSRQILWICIMFTAMFGRLISPEVFGNECDTKEQRILRSLGWDLVLMSWPGQVVPCLSTSVRSRAIPDSFPSLTSSIKEHQEHETHGPCSLSLVSPDWPRDTNGCLALFTLAAS